jgi:hypothetical protein
MTPNAQEKRQRLKSRLIPKAWIGYLVGYNSTNIFRVWNPVTNRVYATRDVVFNEQDFFSPDEARMKETIGEQTLEEIQQRLQNMIIAQEDSLEQVVTPVNGQDEFEINGSDLETAVEDLPVESEEQEEEQQAEEPKYTEARFALLPTPPESPASSFLASSIELGGQRLDRARISGREACAINQAFYAGTLSSPIGKSDQKLITKAERRRLVSGKSKPKDEPRTQQTNLESARAGYHQGSLPPVPTSHYSLKGHRFEKEFIQAEKDHLQSHEQMGSWIEIPSCDPRIRNSQVLDCMWVYVYKTDKQGYLRKCKARLVVRGDQQQKSTTEETYASTLAGKSFRTLMAISARFDLELLQFDAVNAFVNADLHSEVFMRAPPGYRKLGADSRVLLLKKALYGLRIAPLLWQMELGNTLRASGFQPIPHEPCCYQQDGVLIFFYVDDIVLAHRKSQERAAKQAVKALKAKYKLTGGGELQWFLGMEVIRDRTKGLVWLTQTAYLEKIHSLRDQDLRYATPMSKTELVPFDGVAKPKIVNWYRRVIGSLLYAAVITRPDIAFAVSRLARVMMNPGPEHEHAANRVLCYVYATRYLALSFGGADEFEVHSDASFADNTFDRKSSQAYAMKLFGGLIGWRANKQDTVTTSTTEAELLALSQAAKEGLFQQRLLSELGIELQNPVLNLHCDNQQTIGLLQSSVEKLRTKLKHVDIHNHWLREKITRKTICVSYERSSKMIADGLTKSLQGEQFVESRRQLGLVDLQPQIEARRDNDLEERSLQDILRDLQLN